MKRLILLLALLTIPACGQTEPPRPAFADYPVKQIYEGPPARPILNRKQRMFRTKIREGAKSHVEFAGHYTVPVFGCGGGCSIFYIVDSITGRVYDGFAIDELPGRWLEEQSGDLPERIQFVPSSRLLKVNGCPDERACGFYDYVMVDGKGLKLIKKQLLPADDQP